MAVKKKTKAKVKKAPIIPLTERRYQVLDPDQMLEGTDRPAAPVGWCSWGELAAWIERCVTLDDDEYVLDALMDDGMLIVYADGDDILHCLPSCAISIERSGFVVTPSPAGCPA